jgi:hypothetical protein
MLWKDGGQNKLPVVFRIFNGNYTVDVKVRDQTTPISQLPSFVQSLKHMAARGLAFCILIQMFETTGMEPVSGKARQRPRLWLSS